MAFSVGCTSSMAITSRTGFSTPPTITGGLPWSRAAHPVPLAILAPTGATWSSTSLDSVSYGSQPSAAPSFQRGWYRQLTRLALYRAGHPEGYGDAMGNLFRLVYERVSEFRQGKKAAAELEYPTFAEGARMVAIVEAVLTSARRGGEWVAIA